MAFPEEKIAARLAARPTISYDEALPVTQRRREIADALVANPVIIVCGETGSGKTTQLPKICLELGRGCGALIGHTQPRRIAARSTASDCFSVVNVTTVCPVARAVRAITWLVSNNAGNIISLSRERFSRAI